MKCLLSTATILIATLACNVALAQSPNIGDPYSQTAKDVTKLVSSQGLKEYYCYVDYSNSSMQTRLNPRSIFAKSEAEAFQICLNSNNLLTVQGADGKTILMLTLDDGTNVTVSGVAVHLGAFETK